MDTQILRINPFDTFFFRDGKPFSMGEETWADGIFPPAPSVIYGALRSLWLSQQEEGFSEENVETSERLVIKGIFLEFNTDIALPTPRDVVHEKGNPKMTLGISPTKSKVIGKSQIQNIATQSEVEYVEEFSNTFLSYFNYEDYLNGNVNELQVNENFLVDESKIGIGRQFGTRTTLQSSLYRVDMKRFKQDNISILVECSGLDFSAKSIAKLGGEGKAAAIELIEDKHYTEILCPNSFDDNCFKLCVATPTIFKKHGWLPEWINPITFEGNYKGLKLKLQTTVLGKPISIGGFNMKTTKKVQRGPKVMYKAIPVGSVYHFKLLEGSMEKVKETFHYQSISEHKAHEGFGITYIGK
ncbi:MAG: type III-B CRISPR module-associated protein Cmr3 [Chitinophagales bacterium]